MGKCHLPLCDAFFSCTVMNTARWEASPSRSGAILGSSGRIYFIELTNIHKTHSGKKAIFRTRICKGRRTKYIDIGKQNHQKQKIQADTLWNVWLIFFQCHSLEHSQPSPQWGEAISNIKLWLLSNIVHPNECPEESHVPSHWGKAL